MTGYTFQLTCPACAGPVDHITNSAPTPTRSAAIIRCNTCGIDGLVTVHVSMAYNPRDDIGIDTSDRRRAKDRERKRNQRARQGANA